MYKKLLAFVVIASLCLCPFSVSALSSGSSSSSLPTSGVQSPDPNHGAGIYNTGTGSGRVMPMATGLIGTVSLDIYDAGSGRARVVAETIGTDTMNKIGVQHLELQKWVNSSWVNVYDKTLYAYNTDNYFYDVTTTVARGYSYRVVATHYAEKDFWIFPSIQTFYNESDYIYID